MNGGGKLTIAGELFVITAAGIMGCGFEVKICSICSYLVVVHRHHVRYK